MARTALQHLTSPFIAVAHSLVVVAILATAFGCSSERRTTASVPTAPAPVPLATAPVEAAEPEMVLVPAGPFWMGCNREVDRGCRPTEFPYRQVTVPAFRIDRTEVTQGDYARCVAAGACAPPSARPACRYDPTERAHYPVTCIDWFRAHDYCAWADKRLCSEAEWEKAARGDDGRVYPWGNAAPTCEVSHNSDCGTGPLPAGTQSGGASPYGVLDMAGNVREWVEDDWFDSHEGAPDDGSARVATPRRRERVRRGCCFEGLGGSLRTSARMSGPAAQDGDCFGIRCCADAQEGT